MKKWERWSFNALHVVVAATGTAYFWTKYLLRSDDPFAVINHPWQPAMLSLHVLAAPVFIVFFGMLFHGHTLQKITSPTKSNRRTGWTSLLSFSAMALSGYLLQVVSNSTWLGALAWVHVSTSVLFVAGYTVHLVIGWHVSVAANSSPAPEPILPDTAGSPS